MTTDRDLWRVPCIRCVQLAEFKEQTGYLVTWRCPHCGAEFFTWLGFDHEEDAAIPLADPQPGVHASVSVLKVEG